MPLSTFALNALADYLASLATEVSLHSADPGATGLNETTAARQVPAWTAAASGDISFTGTESFTGGAASGPVTYAGLWDGLGNFLGGFQIPNDGTNDLAFNAAGEYDLNDIAINGSTT